MDPVTGGLMGAGAAGHAFLSHERAEAQNDLIDSQQASAREVARLQGIQVAQQLAVQREKRISDLQAIQGRLRVAAGESGIGVQSLSAVQQQADTNFLRNSRIDEINSANQFRAIEARTDTRLTRLEMARQDPLVSAFAGAISGANTGLSVSRFISEVGLTQDE